MEWNDLSIAERRKLASMLAEERLPQINKTLSIIQPSQTIYARYVKRLIDILVSGIGLLITLPVNLIIALVTLFDVGHPIFFKQERIGKGEKNFTLIKFRNMRNEYDVNGDLLPAAQRVTRFGKFVRKTSLDELLNLWSVFRGDMSLIGPRPLLPQYLERFNARHRCRFYVRPGLECPPRVVLNGKWTWQERFENDVWYVENLSFLVDCKMVVNMFRYAFDPKMSTMRANAMIGTFMGYDFNGNAITQYDIEEDLISEFLEYERSKVIN